MDTAVDENTARGFGIGDKETGRVPLVVGARFDQVGTAELASADTVVCCTVRLVDWGVSGEL